MATKDATNEAIAELDDRIGGLEQKLGPALHAMAKTLERLGPPDLRSLDERMAAVQAEIEDVPRRGHAEVEMRSGGRYSYDYVTEADLMTGVRPLLAKHGVAFYYADEIVEYRDGHAHVRVTVTLAAGSEQRVFSVDGWGNDLGDKAANKAKTSALRYWLWKTFLQPNDEDDPEAENVATADAQRAARATTARRSSAPLDRAKLVQRIGQLSMERDELAGLPPGRTLGAIPDLAREAFGLSEPYPAGADEQHLVAIGKQLAEHVANERARKESDPEAYSPADLELRGA
jgi:hypothetical protein